MKQRKQLYAVMTRSNWSNDPAVPVLDEQDAIKKTLESRGICFSTYETEIIENGGKEFKGEPQNGSARRYVGIDRIYNREQVFQDMEAIFGKMSASDSVRQSFMRHPDDSVYITGLERPGEFIRVGNTEKVFNRAGGQLWPVVAPDITLSRDITASQPLRISKHPGPKR